MHDAPTIAIIGAGPSGLVFARLLELAGIVDYVIFERDASAVPGPGQQGGTLDLHESSGQLALKRAGLFEQFSTSLARWDASCIHVLESENSTVMRSAGDDRPEIDRLQLRKLLLDSVPAHKIRWGHSARSIAVDRRKKPDTASKIHFSNGTSASGFRLIVGADGAWSKVRASITDSKPVYSGKMFIEGRISPENSCYVAATKMAGPGNAMVLGDNKMLCVQQVADHSYRTYFGLQVKSDFVQRIEESESGNPSEQIRRLLLSSQPFYRDWNPALKALIKCAEGDFRAWPLYRLDPARMRWDRCEAPGMTLLGDAAHLSTPFAGEGVNCSMLDAVVLADAVVQCCGRGDGAQGWDSRSLETALSVYETDMFRRGEELIQKSTQIENVVFGDDAGPRLLEFFMKMQQEAA